MLHQAQAQRAGLGRERGAPGTGSRVYKRQEIRRNTVFGGKTRTISSFILTNDYEERMMHAGVLDG